MAKFEHYLYQGGVRMRCGYTTGSCAALAAKAAARRLLLGENSRTEAIITPSGIRVEVDICALSQDGRSAACGVYKDAGDDIDVTDGALAALNQLLKLFSVVLGARLAVGVGGERGFVTGAAVGLLYMALGYVLYWQLGGALFSAAAMLLGGLRKPRT